MQTGINNRKPSLSAKLAITLLIQTILAMLAVLVVVVGRGSLGTSAARHPLDWVRKWIWHQGNLLKGWVLMRGGTLKIYSV